MFSPLLTVPIAALSSISGGMHYGWTSAALPQLSRNDSYISMTENEGYWVAVGYFCGSFTGSFIITLLTRLLGHKNSIKFSAALFLISWIIIAYASSASQLIIARILCGIADSIVMCIMPAYLAEISKPSIRGFVVSSVLVGGMIGILLVNVIGTFTSVKSTALLALPLPVLTMLLFGFMPESPYRLVVKNQSDQARKALQQLRNAENVEEELMSITTTSLKRTDMVSLFTDKYNLQNLFVCIALVTFGVFSGHVALIFHTQYIFTEADGATSSFVSSIIYLSIELISTAIASSFMDKVGRRPLLMVSIIGVTITLFVQFGYFYAKNVMKLDTRRYNFVPLLDLILFILSCSFGLETIPFVLSGELFPPNVKFFALSLRHVFFCIANMIVLKIFQLANDNFGIHAPFLIFALCNLIGFVFVYYFAPETKRKTLEQIQNDFRVDDGEYESSEMKQMCKPTQSIP